MTRCSDCGADVYWCSGTNVHGQRCRVALDVAPSDAGRWHIGIGFFARQLTAVAASEKVAAGERLHTEHRDTCGTSGDRALVAA